MSAISVKGVSKRYRIFPSGRTRLKEVLSFGKRKYGRDFWALDSVDFEVEPGTTLGIVGRNGAGKSTLLNIISGILQPTTGSIEVNGRLVAIYGVGAGFDSEFTGRENVILNGLILGMNYREIVERFDDIAALADIGDFMEQPIKTYSSGMRSRLGFAVAANVEPDILILDEVFAVGDAVYKETALKKMYELRDSGTTILFVSHSMETVKNFCTEAILLHEGRVLESGEPTEVVDRYHALVSSIREQRKRQETDSESSPDFVVPGKEGEGPEDLVSEADYNFNGRAPRRERGGPREARVRKVELLDEHLHPLGRANPGSTVTIRVHLEYLEAVKDSEIVVTLCYQGEPGKTEIQESQFYGPNLGYVLELYERYTEEPGSVDEGTREFFETWSPPQAEANGHAPAIAGELFSASTAIEGIPLKMEKGEQIVVDFTFKVPLQYGHYSITAAARTGSKDLHRVDEAASFEITHPQDSSQNSLRGIVHLPTDIKVHASEGIRQGRSA